MKGCCLSKALYAELADTLRKWIAEGRYPLGSTLPSELALSSQHGVSRATARAALAILQRQGFVTRRPRVGSVVVATKERDSYSVKSNSAADLLRFSGTTDLHLVQTEDISADLALAHELGCDVGESWIKAATYRSSPDTGIAVSWTDFYLRPEHRKIVPLIGKQRGSIHHLLDSVQQRPVERIEQQIEACALPKDVGAILGVPASSPALKAVYRIFSEGDKGRFYVAVSLYPEGRFRLSQTLLREH